MKRVLEEKLLKFCADQNRNFQASAWLSFTEVPKPHLAAASLFLAGEHHNGWLKHRTELLEIAKHCAPPVAGLSLSKLAQATDFDPSRFRHMLRHLLDHAHTAS